MIVMKYYSVSRYLTGLFLLIVVVGCGRKPESDFPGNCTLSCSNAIIGSPGEYDIEPAGDISSINYNCGKLKESVAFPKPVRIHFRVLRTVERFKDTNDPTRDRPHPIPYISFEPAIIGVLNTNVAGYDENDAECSSGTAASTSPRCGVWTPQEQWCTDSCGLATIEVWPVCVAGFTNEVTVSLHSGSLFTKQSFKIVVNSEKDDGT